MGSAMTREDVIRMAREAGLFVGTNMAGVGLVGASWEPGKVLTHLTIDDMQRFAGVVAVVERNACVEACRDVARDRALNGDRDGASAANECAETIRGGA